MYKRQVNDKVHSVVFDVEQRHGRLWGVAECQISGELSAGELAALKKYISGQASDGWGEGFEQQEITLDGGREPVSYTHLDVYKRQYEQIPYPFGPP